MISIYVLINPIDKSIFYVGATKHPRSRTVQHICEINYCNNKKSNKIKEILSKGLSPELVVLDECHPTIATESENYYIALFKKYGHDLCQVQKSTYSLTYETRIRSAIIRGRWKEHTT